MIGFKTPAITAAILTALFICNIANAAEPLWTPVADTPYLQEINQTIATSVPVAQMAVHNRSVYAVVGEVLCVLKDGELQPVTGAPTGITLLKSCGSLWASTPEGIHRMTKAGWEKVGDQIMVDLCMRSGSVLYGATRDDVYRWSNEKNTFVSIKPDTGFLSDDMTVIMADGSQVLSNPVRIGPIQRIVSYSDTLYILQPVSYTHLTLPTN